MVEKIYAIFVATHKIKMQVKILCLLKAVRVKLNMQPIKISIKLNM